MSKPSSPVSDRRLAANRANATKSTGPRTAEGKAVSSQNAVKHGFRSSSFAVVRLEELDEIANLKADAISCYCPANAQELIAVERIALAQQMIFRAARLEAGLFTDALNEATDPYQGFPVNPMTPQIVGDGDIEITRRQNRNYFLAEGMARTPIHPGEHLREELEMVKVSAAELSRKLGVPTNRVTGILN